jgi:UDP-N-acetylglucosamine 2-epimerase
MMGDMLRPRGPLACVVGGRPNYMKMAPLVRAFGARPGLRSVVLVHTGQHYDVAMNERLFADLDMPASDLLAKAFRRANCAPSAAGISRNARSSRQGTHCAY